MACAGELKDLADQRGMVKGHLWLVWDTNGAARMVMGPPPERGAASEQFSFGAQMAGMTASLFGSACRMHFSLSTTQYCLGLPERERERDARVEPGAFCRVCNASRRPYAMLVESTTSVGRDERKWFCR